MTDPHGGRSPHDAPAHPEPDPRLQGYPPPAPPGWAPNVPALMGPLYYPPGPPVLLRPPSLPLEPARYSSLLRGPRYRWWKPLLALALGLALFIGLSLVCIVPPIVVGLVTGVPDLGGYVVDTLSDLSSIGPVAYVGLNLSLIMLIPAAMLSIWVVYGVRPRFLSSVTGGIRWRWLLRCLLWLAPLWVLYIGGSLLYQAPTSPRPEQWVALLIIVVLMTPLQAAAEEYFFRGWIMQNVGAWFARPLVGLVVTTVVSTVLFSLAHGSLDIWVLGSIGCLAVAACLATWRTGGLEAAIAMHAVNNVLVSIVAIGIGGWDEVFVSTGTNGTVIQFLLSAFVHGAALALVWWQAKRSGLPYLSRPSAPPAPLLPPPPALWYPVAPLNQTF